MLLTRGGSAGWAASTVCLLALVALVGCGGGGGADGDTDTTPPDDIADLTAEAQTPCSISLAWTAVGDDGATGTAAGYDLRYSTAVITEGNWASAVRAEGEPAPGSSGTDERLIVTGLLANTPYHFRVVVADESENLSDLSNAATATTLPSGTLPGVAWVKDGPGQDDQDWTNLTAQLSASWAAVAGAASYQYSIGTAPGGTNVANWQAPPQPRETTVTRTGLALAAGTKYYFSARALIEGGCSGYGTSDGITVDTSPPASQVEALPETTYAGADGNADITVHWGGADNASGIGFFDIQAKTGEAGQWTDWSLQTTQDSAVFTGAAGTTYYFRCRATDVAGNAETYPGGYDAFTRVVESSLPPREVNANYKIALHLVAHAVKSCADLPVVSSLGDITRTWSQTGPGSTVDAFFVIFDFDSLYRLDFGLDWPTDWGTGSFHACAPAIQVGDIVSPGDGVALNYVACQASIASGGTRPNFLPACWIRLTPMSDGEIEIGPNPAASDLSIVDCRPLPFRKSERPKMIYNAGVNVDPYEGPPPCCPSPGGYTK